MTDPPPILAALIRAGYLPLDQQRGVDARGRPREDPSYQWRPRAAEVHVQAWRVLRACGEAGDDGRIARVDTELLTLVLALIEAGELPRWYPDWQGRLDGVVRNARHLLELSRCEDCAIVRIKREMGLPTRPDPLAEIKARRDAARSNGAQADTAAT